MNSREAAIYLGMYQPYVQDLTTQGLIPARKVGRFWEYDPDDLDTWSETHPKKSWKIDMTVEELRQMTNEMGTPATAKKLGVTYEAIYYHLNKDIKKRGKNGRKV